MQKPHLGTSAWEQCFPVASLHSHLNPRENSLTTLLLNGEMAADGIYLGETKLM